MKILAIETSCDETALSAIEVTKKSKTNHSVRILADILHSQIEKHKEFGGVVPSIAKREHALHITPIIKDMLLTLPSTGVIPNEVSPELFSALNKREEVLAEELKKIAKLPAPDIDAIAVTYGPGLEPALWIGIHVAEVLAGIWKVPLIPINHMEGHILVSFFENDHLNIPHFPLLSLLVSGGHTELVLSPSLGEYIKMGDTRDDAAGECFDKTARLLGLPYPGGPHISLYAKHAREKGNPPLMHLPRPMINDPSHDFSFSGLKTAVRYAVDEKKLSDKEKEQMALAIEEAIVETLVEKTKRALEETGAKTLALGGGVSANITLRKEVKRLEERVHGVDVVLSSIAHSTDNAVMIALAAYINTLNKTIHTENPLQAAPSLSF